MKNVVYVMIILGLLASGSLWAKFDPGAGQGVASAVAVSGIGWGVQIANADGSGGSVLLVVFPNDTPGGGAQARAEAVAENVKLLADKGQLGDIASMGNINYGYLGAPINDYQVYVLGPPMYGGSDWVKNNVVTVDKRLAKFYSTTPAKLAKFLCNRLRGLAAVNSTGSSAAWTGVDKVYKDAVQAYWNDVK